MTAIKAKGNGHFKTSSFVEAIAAFSEAISLYKKNEETAHKSPAALTLVTACYTNRALGWHKLDNQKRALEDSSYVIEKLEAKNAKALFRRAHAYKSEGMVDKAIADLKVLTKVAPTKEGLVMLDELQKKAKEPKP